jgi:hypothetical protein
MPKIVTFEEFIEKSVKLHGNKFIYNEFDKGYKNKTSEIFITCVAKNHTFKQTVIDHLRGRGCAKCAGICRTVEDFIEKARFIHGDYYGYSKFIYLGAKIDGIITCPIHGDFPQNPNTHINNKGGCTICGNERQGTKKRKSFEEFVRQANLIHNNRYSYPEFIYKNNATDGYITCSEHGIFSMAPASHLDKESGCPKCSPKSRGEFLINEFLTIRKYDYIYNHSINIGPKRNKFADFYISSLNLIIEFNGAQHYSPIRFGKQTQIQAERAFKKQQNRDELLRLYCIENNINLFEIDGRKFDLKSMSLIKANLEPALSSYIFRIKSKLYFTRNKID